MTRHDQNQETPTDYDQPIKRRKMPPLPVLPDREWLNATIIGVDYRFTTRNGQIQYITDANGDQVIDEDTNLPIKRTEFAVTFFLKDYSLPGDQAKPRQAWLTLGNSLGEKAHLPKFLANCDVNIDLNNPPSPSEVRESLMHMEVRLQVTEPKVSTTDPNKIYQNVIWDAVKAIPMPDNIPASQKSPVAWDEDK